jgi:uncharacterized protein with von Willebrand factor type A (vWA) domain
VGVRIMLPHVDEFLPAHNIKSLVELGRTLAREPQRGRNAAKRARLAA